MFLCELTLTAGGEQMYHTYLLLLALLARIYYSIPTKRNLSYQRETKNKFQITPRKKVVGSFQDFFLFGGNIILEKRTVVQRYLLPRN